MHLTQNEISFVRLDGRMSASQRNAVLEKWKAGIPSVFIISLKAGGIGLNLTEASRVYMVSLKKKNFRCL
jgi:SNF2 family DNA or RNA helicase